MSAEEQARLWAAGILLAIAIGMIVIAAVDRWRKVNADLDTFIAPPPVVRCGECTDVLNPDNPRAPSCLAHDTCHACAPTPGCTMCAYELELSGLVDPAPRPIAFGESEQAWGWSS